MYIYKYPSSFGIRLPTYTYLAGCPPLLCVFPQSTIQSPYLPTYTRTHTEEELREREVFLARQRQQQQEAAAAGQQAAAAAASEGIDPLLQADPLQAVSDIVSAYTAEQGFREMGVQELSVALTAGGGLVDLVLDVRSHAEFAAGGFCCGHVGRVLRVRQLGVRACLCCVKAGVLCSRHGGSYACTCLCFVSWQSRWRELAGVCSNQATSSLFYMLMLKPHALPKHTH